MDADEVNHCNEKSKRKEDGKIIGKSCPSHFLGLPVYRMSHRIQKGGDDKRHYEGKEHRWRCYDDGCKAGSNGHPQPEFNTPFHRMPPVRKGFDFFSCPMVVCSPCPERTTVLSGREKRFFLMVPVSSLRLPPGKSVRPMEP